MPREVVFLDYCDFCAENEEQTEGQAIELALQGIYKGQMRSLIVCEPHHKEHVAPLARVFEKFAAEPFETKAVPKETPARQRGPRIPRPVVEAPCLICKKLFNRDWTASNLESLNSHRTNFHGVSTGAYRMWVYGLAELSIKDEAALTVNVKLLKIPAGVPDYLHCPGCDNVFDPHAKSEASAYSGLAGHYGRAHPELPPLANKLEETAWASETKLKVA